MRVRSEYAECYVESRATQLELDDVRTRRSERAQEADRLRHLLDEHERLAPQEGETGSLRAEVERLGHADVLQAAAAAAHTALLGDEALPDSPDSLGLLAAARRSLDAVRDHDKVLAALADRLAEASYTLVDVGTDLSDYASNLEADPARLQAAQERLSVLAAAARARGLDHSDALNTWATAAAHRYGELADDDTREADLAAELARLRTRLGALAADLSARRQEAARALAAGITEELGALAMPHAAISVAVRQRPDVDGLEVGGRALAFGPSGVDEVELELIPHPGAPARPLHKGASGGELSRVMLAVEVVLAAAGRADGALVPTFVFDEVDAGVGGRAAVEVGRRLARLAEHAQVVVVTHLPQVAAFADRHLIVEKSTDGTVTSSGVRVLEDSARVAELSRMLAGMEGSELALGHAEELLAAAADSKAHR